MKANTGTTIQEPTDDELEGYNDEQLTRMGVDLSIGQHKGESTKKYDDMRDLIDIWRNTAMRDNRTIITSTPQGNNTFYQEYQGHFGPEPTFKPYDTGYRMMKSEFTREFEILKGRKDAPLPPSLRGMSADMIIWG